VSLLHVNGGGREGGIMMAAMQHLAGQVEWKPAYKWLPFSAIGHNYICMHEAEPMCECMVSHGCVCL